MPARRRRDAELPGEFAPCVSYFLSPLQRRRLSRAVVTELLASGLRLTGTIAAGFSPEGFSFPDPSSPQAGVLVNDATWGKGAKLKVCFLDRSRAIPDIWNQVERFAKLWSAAADVAFEFGA